MIAENREEKRSYKHEEVGTGALAEVISSSQSCGVVSLVYQFHTASLS